MKKIIFNANIATRKIHYTPTSGARLISLDYYYTKKYNNNYEICVTQFNHLLSECKLSHKGANLVANTLRNYTQKFKKSIFIFVSLLILPNLAFSAGIPVVDVTANQQMSVQNAKEIAEWAKQASRWTETVSHYQKQIQAYKDELLSKTGVRDSVSFLRDIKQIYSDFAEAGENIQSFYNNVLRDPQDFLSDKGNEIFGKYTSFDRCNYNFMSQNEKNICKINLITYAAQVETYNQASKQMDTISETLKKLQDKLVNSKDIKESTDVGNAIQLEVAKIQMVKNQIDLANASYENQRKIKEDMAIQEYSKSSQNLHNEAISDEEAAKYFKKK
ncbi:type IV secretion system protein [Campylobacter jejuni]|uniref:type IV secretion system protein n=1 Tax=Campylobacter jejuni TaxID=197 RepID=UPI00073DE300|nr:type IV secretion system protein [Campylobacter jejuni]ALW49327.1 type IV secretion system protein [Campylobacter jejuni]ALW65301.1 type IV secretion system protein [Campylobacter jejuni]ALW69239.1 type IV secretion system protein [Campylobacter jejuni]EAK8099003.1 type IV secretion system protein [Campylobacter jejuni]EAL0578657.1 type IV secretion system protein [Campylobacter jejuni]